MLEIVFWVLISFLFLLSFSGLVFPIIPSVIVLWGGFLLYHFGINQEELSWVFWVMMMFFTGILMASDIVANSYFVKKFGGSKWGERMAGFSVIAGSFIMPPFGLLVVPFVVVWLTEKMQKKTWKAAGLASVGSLIGFLSSTVAKFIGQLVMLGWFFVEVFIF